MKDSALYLKLYDDIIKKIKSNEYSENKALPSERKLCSIYFVSRSTVRKALTKLRNDKYIKTVRGSGNYVNSKVYYQPLTNFHSFAHYLIENSSILQNKILSCQIVDNDSYLESITNMSKIKWHKLTRLRCDKNIPLMIETSYLLQSRFFKINPNEFENNSLYRYLEKYYNMKIDLANEFMAPILPTIQQAELLEISSKSPCMLLERICYEENQVIIVHKTIVRGDKYRFKSIYKN